MIELPSSERKVALKAHFHSATSTIRFPAYFTVLWKSNDSSILQETAKAQVKQGFAAFDQALTLSLTVPFNEESQQFTKCETQIHLRLISKAKQHQQPKLVGKMNLQISCILNNPQALGTNMDFPLGFCSVNASLKISFEVQEITKSQIAKSHIMSNATPPKSPPTLAFVKSKEATIKQPSQDKKAEKISLSATKGHLPNEKGERSKDNERKILAAEQQNVVKQIQNLKRINQKITCELDQMRNSLAENSQSLSICQEELFATKIENEKLRQEIRKKLDQNVKLQLLMSEVSEQNSQKTFLLAASQRENHKFEIINSQLERAENQKKELKAKLKQLEEAVHQLNSQKYNLQRQLKTSINQANHLKNQIQSRSKEISILEENHRKLKTESQKLYSSISNQKQHQSTLRLNLQKKVSLLEGKIADFQQRFFATQTTQTAKQQQHKQLQSLNAERLKKINQLQYDLMMSKAENKALNQIAQNLQIQLKQVQEELAISQIEIRRISQTSNQIQQRLQQKLAESESLSALLNKKSKQLQVCQLQKNLINQQLHTLKEKHSNQLEQLQRHKNKISELEEILLINNEIKAKELQEQQVRQRNSQAKVREVEQQNKVQLQNCLRLQERTAILEREIAEREILIERLQNGLAKQMNANQAKNTKLIALQQTLQSHLQQIVALQGQLLAVKELISIQEKNEEKLIQKIADLQLQLYELLTAYECLQSKSKDLELQQQKKSAENYSALNEMVGLLDAQQNYSQSLKSQLAKHQEQLEMLKNNLKETTSENQRLLKQIDEMQTFAQKVNQQKDKIIFANAKENNSLKQQIAILNKKIATKNTQFQQKASQLQKQVLSLNSSTNQLAKYKAEAQKLRSQIQLSLKQRNSLKQQVQKLKKQIQQLQNLYKAENAELQAQCQHYNGIIHSLKSQRQQQIDHFQREIFRNSQDAKKLDAQIQQLIIQLKSKEIQIETLKTLIPQPQIANEEIPINIITCKSEASQQQLPAINIINCQSQASQQEGPVINIIKCQSQASEQDQPLINVISCKSESSYEEQPLNNAPVSDKIVSEKSFKEEMLRAISQKDEQILELQLEIDRLASYTNQAYDLMEQVQAYKQELELHEEERIAFETAAAQNSLDIAQLREQNAALKEELCILTEKCNQLELNLYLLQQEKQAKTQTQLNEQNVDYQLKIEVSNLRVRVKELEDRNDSLQAELDDKEEKHVVDLIDQHIRLSKSDQLENHAKSNSRINKEALPDFIQTCHALMQTLSIRTPLSLNLGRDVTHQPSEIKKSGVENIPQYSRMVSLELQKLKSQLLKGDRKTSISDLFKNCQNSIRSLCAYVQECCSYQ